MLVLEPPFRIVVRPGRDQLVVEAHGEIDLVTAPRLRDIVSTLVTEGCTRLVVDFRTVTFMDSAGVHVLEHLHALQADGVECRMVDGNPEVSRILELVGLTAILAHIDAAEL